MWIYLSGTIAGMTYEESNKWRLEVTDKLRAEGIGTLNPLRGRMFFNADDEVYDPNEIVTRDLRDVSSCDLVLAYLPQSARFSIGTTCEIWHAYFVERKPVVLVSDDPKIAKHPWMQVACTKMFPDMDSALSYIIDRFRDDDESMVPEKW